MVSVAKLFLRSLANKKEKHPVSIDIVLFVILKSASF
jgi:hypothetical protein